MVFILFTICGKLYSLYFTHVTKRVNIKTCKDLKTNEVKILLPPSFRNHLKLTSMKRNQYTLCNLQQKCMKKGCQV